MVVISITGALLCVWIIYNIVFGVIRLHGGQASLTIFFMKEHFLNIPY